MNWFGAYDFEMTEQKSENYKFKLRLLEALQRKRQNFVDNQPK